MFKKIIAWFRGSEEPQTPVSVGTPRDTEKLEVEAEKVEEVKEIKSKRNGNKRRPRKKVVKEN